MGTFVISLDFELFWGVRDKRTIADYGTSIANVRTVMPRLLDTFSKYGVKATFATVGLLFSKDKAEMRSFSPNRKPKYLDSKLSPYTNDFNEVGLNESKDPHHFALDVIRLIQNRPEHEISTHTFSHYYCLEDGQAKEDFEADIEAAIAIAKKENCTIKSIVFPRNQFNENYSDILIKNGIKSYRGNEKVWFQSYQNEDETTLLKKVFRTANCYINLSGHHCYSLKELSKSGLPFDIPSSRFLRPYQARFPFLRTLQLIRIKSSMTYAAKNDLMFHLWWHPHNFGANIEENFETLHSILKHYSHLKSKYGFESRTMDGVCELLEKIRRSG